MTFETMMQITGFGLVFGGSAKIGWESAGVICWLVTNLTRTAIGRWRWRQYVRDCRKMDDAA